MFSFNCLTKLYYKPKIELSPIKNLKALRHSDPGRGVKCLKPLRKHSRLSGQAAVEYILLVAFMSLIFGVMFGQIRQGLFRLWVCEMAPRIQSPMPCGSTQECLSAAYAGDPETLSRCQ